MSKPSPIFPYVGFKGWQRGFIRQQADAMPEPFEVFDPFIGGGGSLQALAGHKKVTRFEVSDIMQPLTDLWRWLLRDPAGFREDFEALVNANPPSTEAYYRVREEAHEDPAAFLYVLLWGFNGLYRSNLKGRCNVPQGKGPRHLNPPAAVERVFVRAQELRDRLRAGDHHVYIETMPFEQAMAAASTPLRRRRPVLAYFDPPFVGTFTSYAGPWTQGHLDHLLRSVQAMASIRRGTYLVCGVPENFQGLDPKVWTVHQMNRKSSVSRSVDTRGDYAEAVAVVKS